jgi:sec-independent protein translocase protein TatA
MDTIGVPELLLILVIVLLLFGVGRIGKIGGEIGQGIKAFRDGLKSDEPQQIPAEKPAQKPAETMMQSSQSTTDHVSINEDTQVK